MVRLATFIAAAAALPMLSVAFSPNAPNAPSTNAEARSGVFKMPFARSFPEKAPSSTERSAMLTQTELPEKLYFGSEDKEFPKVLGGIKIGTRELVVITGASSGLGLYCAKTLISTGKYFVVMACRDIKKAKKGEFKIKGMLASAPFQIAPVSEKILLLIWGRRMHFQVKVV